VKRKTVITGIGLATPFGGKTVEEDWQSLLQGKCARRRIDFFDVTQSRCQEAAYLPSPFNPSSHSRAIDLSTHALHQCLENASLLNSEGRLKYPETPFSVSTTAGAMAQGEKFVRNILAGQKRNLLKTVYTYQGQQQVLELQQHFGILGRTHIVCNACASGANAIGHGHEWIQAGWTDCAIVGGYEALTELLFYGFDSLQSLAPDSCKPFDTQRNGLMLGEGAAFLVLEEETHALKRGVSPLATLLGYGHSTDTHHLTQPHPEGIALTQAINAALKEATLDPSQLGYLNAHGTGTPMNDGAELNSYQKSIPDLSSLFISSTKAATGHTLGVAGAMEAIFALLALREGIAPPQINNQNPIPGIENSLVPLSMKPQNFKSTMSVNLGFGGSNAALIFGKAS
jgi:3-oxoacyl-[acyl-carrier-protein] synthase II